MRRYAIPVFLTIALAFLLLPIGAQAASKMNIGINGGAGLPLGWWGDRWGFITAGEFNVRYELSPGAGLLVLGGLSKSYIKEMSKEDVSKEARRYLHPDFTQYSKIELASQDGSYQQIPIGFGIYYEQMITPPRLRGYGSVALVVHLWKTQRNQSFQETVAPTTQNFVPVVHLDNWSDHLQGSDLGGQAVLGVTFQLSRSLYLDASAAYHYVRIDPKNNAIAYWGQPARNWSEERLSETSGQADLLQLRFGIRFGG